MFLQGFVCDEPCLWESIHSFSHFEIYISIDDVLFQVVLLLDFDGDKVVGDADILIALHLIVEIEVLHIEAEPFGGWVRDCAVDEYFGCCHVGSGRADVAGIRDDIAACG